MIHRLLAAFSSVLLLAPAHAQWHSDSWDSMGTRATLEFWHTGNNATDIIGSVHQEFDRLQQLLSPWIESSELAQFNALPAKQTLDIHPEFFLLLNRSAYYHRLSDGAFDITFAGAGHLYDFRNGKAPDDAALQQAVIGMHYLDLETANQVSKKHSSVRIDLGGIAKGYAIDRAVALLREQQIEHAYVSLGGDSYVLGQRGERPWMVGIRHPRNDKSVAITLPLSDVAVSTSGDYERFFIRDGEYVHHTLNPKTGKPAGGIMSVTIMAPQGIDSDGLSTSVFVLGIEKGLALINRLENISAIIIDRQGKVHYSDDLTTPR